MTSNCRAVTMLVKFVALLKINKHINATRLSTAVYQLPIPNEEEI